MTETTPPLWYQLGFALERARREPTRDRLQELGRRLSAFRTRDQAGEVQRPERNGDDPTEALPDGKGGDAWAGLVATAGGALVAALLRSWPPRSEPGPAGVVRAAAAGAASSVLVELGRRVLEGHSAFDPDELPDRLLSGAARGLIYGAVAEPRLPGPPVLRGLVWGGAEFVASPLGGLPRFLGRHTPYGRLPVVKNVLGPGEDRGDQGGDLLEHLVFGIALALLAGSS